MDFGTAKVWQRVNLADGEYKYEKVWGGGHWANSDEKTLISLIDTDGDICVEVVAWETRGNKVFSECLMQFFIETE